MKILAISGSSTGKKTDYMLRKILESFPGDYQKELIPLKDKNITPCKNCKGCHETQKCVINDDMQEIYQKLIDADAIILGSPTYFDNVSGIMKNFMDRCLPFYFSKKLKNKKVGLVSVAGFKEYIEYDKEGNCIWCKENECVESVEHCLQSMSYFCKHTEMDIIGQVAAIHGSPEEKDEDLIKLGNKLKSALEKIR